MPRPIKLRNVDSMPNNCHFGPLDNQFNNPDVIIMTVDEYETIRLIDLEGLNQEECAKQMNVARTTVQGIYNDARKKIAEFLVNGKKLRIEGGEYKICNGSHNGCHGGRCHKKDNCCSKILNENREVNSMIIAIPADEPNIKSDVCMSYGRTPYFVIYNEENKQVSFLDNSAAACSGGAGILASQTLVDKGVTTVVTQRLGQNAADVLKAADVKILKSIDGNIDENIKACLDGKLSELTNIHPGFHNHGVN